MGTFLWLPVLANLAIIDLIKGTVYSSLLHLANFLSFGLGQFADITININ